MKATLRNAGIWRLLFVCLSLAHQPPVGQGLFFYEVSRSHSQTHTVRRNPLDGWSVRRRDFYLTTHNNHNRQTSMPPVGFETKISAGERPQTHASDRAVTGWIVQGDSNMTGTDLCVNKPHCAAAVRLWESGATTSTVPPARVRTCSVLSGSC